MNLPEWHPAFKNIEIGLPDWHPAARLFRKGWVTINGAHILIGEEDDDGKGGGGSKGKGRANAGATGGIARHADISGTNYKSVNNLVSHEGAPDKGRIDEYKQLIDQGHKIAPVLVTREGDFGNKWGIVDGKHRYAALKATGERFVPTLNKDSMTREQMKEYDSATEADQRAIIKLRK